MKWQRDGNYAIKSGDFVITKNATSEGWIYLVFRNRECIGRTKSAEEAKALCSYGSKK